MEYVGEKNMQSETRLNPFQVKIGMYIKIVDDIVNNLKRYLYNNKIKKITLTELRSVSLKSCYALQQMGAKFDESFFKEEEKQELKKIEAQINYEVVIGKFDKKFKWQYTKELVDYLIVLSDSILERNGIQREDFIL